MQKTKARWAALGSLFQSTGTELKDGLIANKVRQHSKRAAVGLAPSLPTLDEDGGDAGRAGGAASHAGGAAAEPPTENGNGDVAFPVTGAADEAPPEITDLANAAVFAMVDHVDLRDPSRQKPTRQSSIVTLLDVEERENFHVIEGDNPLARVAKLAYLEDEFQAVLRDTKELKTLWYDADNNANGDLSLVEWQSYARDKFNVLSNRKANQKAYNEAAVAPDDTNPASRPNSKTNQERAKMATKGSGMSQPVLNRSNFRMFLQKTFEYNKVWYAFQHLDTSDDDRVQWDEYKARRKIFLKVLEIDPEQCTRGWTAEDEFEDMRVHQERITTASGTKVEHTKASLLALGETDKYITFHSMCMWYRNVLDNNYYGTHDGGGGRGDANTGAVDTSGIIVDVDEFQDLLLNCHYKTRMKLPSVAQQAAAKVKKAASTSKLVKHHQTPV